MSLKQALKSEGLLHDTMNSGSWNKIGFFSNCVNIFMAFWEVWMPHWKIKAEGHNHLRFPELNFPAPLLRQLLYLKYCPWQERSRLRSHTMLSRPLEEYLERFMFMYGFYNLCYLIRMDLISFVDQENSCLSI